MESSARLCAMFDSLGNSVVYDPFGKKRLVYTQSHGVLYDTPNGYPLFWKWHDIDYTGSLTTINDDDEDWEILSVPKPKAKCKETSKKEDGSGKKLTRKVIE